MPPSRIVISSESEKSFSFAVKNRGEERDHGKHRTLCGVESRCFIQTALRRKTETANEKDPSAALGMTIRRGLSRIPFIPLRKPTSAPSGHLLPGGRRECAAFPHRHFERKREIFFVCGQESAVRRGDHGKLHAPCDLGKGGSVPPPRPFYPFKYPHRMAAGAGCIFGVFGMV